MVRKSQQTSDFISKKKKNVNEDESIIACLHVVEDSTENTKEDIWGVSRSFILPNHVK